MQSLGGASLSFHAGFHGLADVQLLLQVQKLWVLHFDSAIIAARSCSTQSRVQVGRLAIQLHAHGGLHDVSVGRAQRSLLVQVLSELGHLLVLLLQVKGWVLGVHLELLVEVFQQTLQHLVLGLLVKLVCSEAIQLEDLRGIHVPFLCLGVGDLLVLGFVSVGSHPGQVLDASLSFVLGNQALLLFWSRAIVCLRTRKRKCMYIFLVIIVISCVGVGHNIK